MSGDRPYRARALALLADQPAEDVMSDLGPALRLLLTGREPEVLERPESADEWSVRQVVGHMLDTELVYGYRLRQTLMTDHPRFERFDQERWVARFSGQAGGVVGSTERLLSLRGWHLEIIATLTREELERPSEHSSRGTESVRDMVDLWAAHDLIHLAQIERILR